MKIFLIGGFCFLTSFLGLGQNKNITGIVKDTAEKKTLLNAAVSLLKAKDTSLLTFARTNTEESFKFNNIPKGDYLLLITFPGYADYYEKLQHSPEKDHQFHTLPMILRSQLLE
jgi:hypothetical protein